jgi:2-succinyl-6-hydroxy-2,4-cyclohexadiene-1-carboxylate synthase
MPLFGKPGERINYTIYPHPNGAPPIVLVHGFTASNASFQANIPALKERFTVVTVELLGHGGSDAPALPQPYGPEEAELRLVNLFRHLGYEQVLLVGHSLGAALCLRLALDAPEWLAGLVVINSNSAAGTPEWRELARPRMLEMGARVRQEGTAFMRETRLYPAHSKRLDPESRELLVKAFDSLTPEGVAGTAEALVVDVNAYERWGDLHVPAMVVIGERDGDFVRAAPELLRRLPAGIVRSVRIPDAGHAANIEQAAVFEAALFRFAYDIGYLQDGPAPATGGFGGRALTAIGAALVTGGVALLAGSLFLAGGKTENQPNIAAAQQEVAPVATATATSVPVTAVAGTRVAGPGAVLPAQPLPTSTSAAPSAIPAQGSPAAAPTATQRPAESTSTATTEPTATPVPSPTPTATPSGPTAAISGPSSAAVGATATFVDSSTPRASVLRVQWATSGGALSTTNPSAAQVTFPAAGCYTITLTTYFANSPGAKTVSQNVSVGGATCGG